MLTSLSRWVVICMVVISGHSCLSAEVTHGPLIGHVTPQSVRIWARANSEGVYQLTVYQHGQTAAQGRIVTADAKDEHDLTMTWVVEGLLPATRYRYDISMNERPLAQAPEQQFTTAPLIADEKNVKIGFGSCAWDVSHPKQPVWTAIRDARLTSMVLLGDTPYIDSTELPVLRQRYRDFWSIAELKDLIRGTPIYATWDDHDFGPDNALGLIPGKANSRQAFLEYHANPGYGLDQQGIFTSFRRGPVEVFLLDTRWFANTEKSPVNPERETLIGRIQWNWLCEQLKKSDAPFKILACGMIWNEAVYPGKLDCWMAYPYEREALFLFLKQAKISGVVLVGGDIHRSRHLIHPTRSRVGYDLHELVTSPLAENPASDNNIPSPYLKYDEELRNSFLNMEASIEGSPPRLTAKFQSESKVHYELKFTSDDLSFVKK